MPIYKIAGLTRYSKKGSPGETLSEARLLENIGMEGDIHQGGDKQLSLLSAETRKWMDLQAERGLCFAKYRENILTDGMILSDLPDGSRLSIGNAVLRVSLSKKHCYGECGLLSRGAECRLSGGAIFAVVERGGIVRIGDSIKFNRVGG